MSDSNRTKVSIFEEATLGATPATPAFEELRVTGSNLAFALRTVESSELRSDRQTLDQPRVALEAGGSIPGEFSFGNLDHLLRGLFYSEWVVSPVRDNNYVASQIASVAATTNVFTVVTSGSNYRANSGAFAVGQIVRAAGFTASANNGLRRCTTASATVPVLAPFSGGAGASVADASPASTARLKVVGFAGAANGEITTTTGPNTITRASGTLDFTTLGLAVGQWLKLSGFTGTPAVNDWVRISAISASVITLDRVPSGWGADAAASVTPVIYVTDYLRNGTTRKSFLIEQQYQDLASPEFEYFRGMVPGELSLEAQADSIITTSLAFFGLNALGPYTTRGGPSAEAYTGAATDVAATTGDIFTASANVGQISEGGTKMTTGPNYCLGVTMTIGNNLRYKRGVGSIGALDIGTGKVAVGGEINMYYGSNSVLTKLRNSTASSYDMVMVDPNGTRAIIVDVPRLKYAEGNINIPGPDTDRTLPTRFTGLRHATLGYTVSYSRCEEFA